MTRHASRDRKLVFGYGSLIATGPRRPTREPHAGGFVAELEGFTRSWGVAMDNSVDLPGYKFYEAPEGGRPDVFVAFLDLREETAPGVGVTGLCLPADDRQLARLDLRERNYVRVDVSDRLGSPPGRIWTYVGRPDARERLREGRRRGRAVIHADYLRSVRAGFHRLGPGEYAACERSLDTGGLPVVELVRRELAPERPTVTGDPGWS